MAWTERTKPTTNQYLSLTGSGYAFIADAAQVGLDMGLSDLMIEAWIKLTVPSISQPGATAVLFDKYIAGEAYYTGNLDRASETIFFSISDGVNAAYILCSASYIDDLQWHSLIFIADRDQVTGLKLFIDGIEIAYNVQQDPTFVDDLDNTAEFTIGAEATSGNDKLNGQIGEIRVWNFGVNGLPTDYADYISWRHSNPLTPTSNYNSGSWNIYVTNDLSAYYKFNGDYIDETANSNGLTAGGSGNTFPYYSLERSKPTDTATERTKPTDTATERADTGGPGYDFSMTNIFWDRTNIYFDSTTLGPTQRTKPTDTWTQRTKET